MEKESSSDEMKKSGSRFQVARVETAKEDQAREGFFLNNETYELGKQRRRSDDERSKTPDVPHLDSYIQDSGSDGRPTSNLSNNGPESPSATFSLNGDSIPSRTWSSIDGYNKTNIVMNTIEALPCVDHYRNVFSATGAGNLRARPTLAELHEEMVRI